MRTKKMIWKLILSVVIVMSLSDSELEHVSEASVDDDELSWEPKKSFRVIKRKISVKVRNAQAKNRKSVHRTVRSDPRKKGNYLPASISSKCFFGIIVNCWTHEIL